MSVPLQPCVSCGTPVPEHTSYPYDECPPTCKLSQQWREEVERIQEMKRLQEQVTIIHRDGCEGEERVLACKNCLADERAERELAWNYDLEGYEPKEGDYLLQLSTRKIYDTRIVGRSDISEWVFEGLNPRVKAYCRPPGPPPLLEYIEE